MDSIAFAFGLIDDPAEMDSSLRAVSRADNGGNAAASPAIPVTLAGNGEMFEECRREAQQGDAIECVPAQGVTRHLVAKRALGKDVFAGEGYVGSKSDKKDQSCQE